MIYQRPDAGSLQQWADDVNDQSYTFDNMLNYLEKSRHFTHPGPSRLLNSTTRYDPSAFYRDGGPLQASSPNNLRPFSTFLGSAFEALDVVQNNGFNSGSLLGSQFCTTTIDPTTGTRSSSQTSFLDAAQSQPNLKIYPETLATRITFDAHKRATGVDIGGAHLAPTPHPPPPPIHRFRAE